MHRQLFIYIFIGFTSALCIQPVAHASPSPSQPANIPQSVQRAPHLRFSSRVIDAAGTSVNVLTDPKRQFTFLAPSDLSCADVAQLHQGTMDPVWAKAFVLNHTVRGQINVERPVTDRSGIRLNLVSDGNHVQSITEGETLTAVTLDYHDLPISIEGGRVHVGAFAHLQVDSLSVTTTGSVGVIDYCREL